jgi:hypothetical protein
MSDFHDDWTDHGYHDYDPRYFYEKDDDEGNNKPVNPDDWARNNEDLEGGF